MDTAIKSIGVDPLINPEDASVKISAARSNLTLENQGGSLGGIEFVDIQAAQEITEKIQGYIDRMDISLKFSTYGKNNDKMSVTVVEKQSGEIVREIPPEEVQRLQTRMEEIIGLIFNGKA